MHSIVLKLSPLLLQLIASQNGPSDSTETENPKSFQNSIMFQMMQKIEEEKKEGETDQNNIVATNNYEIEAPVRAHAQGVTVLRDAGVTVFSVTQEKFVTFRRDGNE